MSSHPTVPGPDDGVYVISVAFEMTGVPPPTLRLYEERGLITPARTAGRTRRYSARDIDRIRRIAELTAAGINLAGVDVILQLEDHAGQLEDELDRARIAGTRSTGTPSMDIRPTDAGVKDIGRTGGGLTDTRLTADTGIRSTGMRATGVAGGGGKAMDAAVVPVPGEIADSGTAASRGREQP